MPPMQMDNPVLARFLRAGALESIHRGAWVLVDPDGTVVDHRGDPDQVIFARSAMKSLQALPLVESGAMDALGLGSAHLALAIASHSGEAVHLDTAADGLERIGLGPDALLCGPQAPFGSTDPSAATRLANNCSGKHVGFLALACRLGVDPTEYLDPDAAVQQTVRAAVGEMTDTIDLGRGLDGCSAPTFHMPLRSLATGLARLTSPGRLSSARQTACRRITDAAAEHPVLVAGTHDRFCTDLLRVTKGRIFGKIGAEGVYAFGVVDAELGFAGKVDDGNARPLYPIMLRLLMERGLMTETEADELGRWRTPTRRNWDGLEVGTIELV